MFFDVDTLTSGKFNEQLLEVIGRCKDFILVLPENALERCADEEDWIRRETLCAIRHGRNIIPVMLDGFVWPDEMPQGMEDLKNYQAITSASKEYFDLQMQRLKGYLKSRPALPLRRWLIKAAVVLGLLLAFVAVDYVVVRHIANVTCEEVATRQANVMGAVDQLEDICQDISDNCASFFAAVDRVHDDRELLGLEKGMTAFLSKTDRDIEKYKKTFPAPDFEMDPIQNYVLSYYGVKQEELKAFSAYYMSLYDDVEEIVGTVKEMTESHDYGEDGRKLVQLNLKTIGYSVNAFYYAYLGSLSLLPKASRKAHYELSGKWTHFPNGMPLDLSQEEYERFQAHEMNCLEEEVGRYGAPINYEDRKLNEMETQINQLEDKLK